MAPKLLHKTDTPYHGQLSVTLTGADHDMVISLLISLLEPIGQHRRTHIRSSHGKKRKRLQGNSPATLPAPPPPPAIEGHITVGLNSTTRHLEALAAASRPNSLGDVQQPSDCKHLAAVFLPAVASPLIHAHFPILSATASLSHPACPPTRLVHLTHSVEKRLAAALGVPRVGVIGLVEGAPGAHTLVDYVRSHVEPAEVPWLNEVLAGKWKGTEVLTVEIGGVQ